MYTEQGWHWRKSQDISQGSRENRKVFRSTDGICGKIYREEKQEIKSSWSNTPRSWPAVCSRCNEKTSEKLWLGDTFHLGYGDTLEALSRAGEAAVNLVVSSVGIPAQCAERKIGTPFLVGTPVEGQVRQISDVLERDRDRSCGEWVNKKDDSAEESGGQILGETGGTVESNSGAGNLFSGKEQSVSSI